MVYVSSLQAQTSVGTRSTHASFFVKSHNINDGTYPNDITPKRCVCKMLFCLLIIYLQLTFVRCCH